jgi:hypothetical protein
LTIEIERPELEALLSQWMRTGVFQSVEDALSQALKSSPPPENAKVKPSATGADLVAAMQASPFKEICLDSSGIRMPVRDVAF